MCSRVKYRILFECLIKQPEQQLETGTVPTEPHKANVPIDLKVGGAGEAAAEEAAVQVREERGAAGAGEIRVRHGELLPELRQRARLRRP
jgi:hypothetical protein